VNLRAIALFVAGCSGLAAPVRAEEPPRTEPPRNEPPHSSRVPASRFHAGASFDLMLAGRLAKLPLTLYGGSLEFGYRLPSGAGPVFTPLVTLRAMRGTTPAGLLYTSHGVLGGVDLAIARDRMVHFGFELGAADDTFHGATAQGLHQALEATGQVTTSLDYRLDPWLALRAGLGYRFLGGVDGVVLFVGGKL
jgi:hypothetical protein